MPRDGGARQLLLDAAREPEARALDGSRAGVVELRVDLTQPLLEPLAGVPGGDLPVWVSSGRGGCSARAIVRRRGRSTQPAEQ